MKLVFRNTDSDGIYWFLEWVSQYDLRLLRALIIEESIKYSDGVMEGYTEMPGQGDPTYKIKCRVYQTSYPTEVKLHVNQSFKIYNSKEAYVFILAHEFYHFLRQTKQVKGKQNEEHADEFAKKTVKKFRLDRYFKNKYIYPNYYWRYLQHS